MPKMKRKPIIPLSLLILQHSFRWFGPLFPNTMARLAYRIWFKTYRVKTPQRELNYLETAQVLPTRVNDKKISVFRWGSHERKILLVHGWNGRGTQLGSFIQPLLDNQYAVISFDAPGHGLSQGKNTNVVEINQVIQQLDRDYGPFDAVIAHSFGALATSVAVDNGLRTKKLIYIALAADVKGLTDKFSQHLAIPEKVVRIFSGFLERDFGADVWDRFSTVSLAVNLPYPGLLFHDKDDYDVPWIESHQVASVWKNAKLITTQGFGHRRILRAQQVIERTVAFITNPAGTNAHQEI